MFTGLVIDELMHMVERAEDHAHTARFASEVELVSTKLAPEELLFNFASRAADAHRVSMIGVA